MSDDIKNIDPKKLLESGKKIKVAIKKLENSEVELMPELGGGTLLFILKTVDMILDFAKEKLLKPDGTYRKKVWLFKALSISGFFVQLALRLLVKMI